MLAAGFTTMDVAPARYTTGTTGAGLADGDAVTVADTVTDSDGDDDSVAVSL